MSMKPTRARVFYATIALTTLAGYLLNYVHAVKAVDGLFYAAVLNGIIAPPLIVVLLLMCNNPRILLERRNGVFTNVFGSLAALGMFAAAGMMLYSLL